MAPAFGWRRRALPPVRPPPAPPLPPPLLVRPLLSPGRPKSAGSTGKAARAAGRPQAYNEPDASSPGAVAEAAAEEAAAPVGGGEAGTAAPPSLPLSRAGGQTVSSRYRRGAPGDVAC